MENRFEARRSRVSLFFKAASELAIAGGGAASIGGVSGGGGLEEPFGCCSGSGLDGSTTRLGGLAAIGLSTNENRLTLAGTIGCDC